MNPRFFSRLSSRLCYTLLNPPFTFSRQIAVCWPLFLASFKLYLRACTRSVIKVPGRALVYCLNINLAYVTMWASLLVTNLSNPFFNTKSKETGLLDDGFVRFLFPNLGMNITLVFYRTPG